MAGITNALMYDLITQMHYGVQGLKTGLTDVKSELMSVSDTMACIQQDIHNVFGVLYQRDQRPTRIERRLDLREMAQVGVPFDYKG